MRCIDPLAMVYLLVAGLLMLIACGCGALIVMAINLP